MWSSSCIPVILLLFCLESTALNPQCTPPPGSNTEFVVDFVFFIDHTLGQDEVDRIKYLYKAISCEIPISRRYRLASAHMTTDSSSVTTFKSSKTFPETLLGDSSTGHSNKDACHRLRFTFDRIKKHLISTNDWKELGVIPLHFVIPVSKAYSGCNVEDEFRNFFENVDNNFNAFLDIISIGTNLRVKDPGVRVEIGSWDDIKTDVPSLTKHKDFKHVYKMDKMLQQYSSWIRKALSGTLVNHVFRRTTRILTTEIPTTAAPTPTVEVTKVEPSSAATEEKEATSPEAAKEEATSAAAKEEVTSSAAAKEEVTSPAAAKEEATSPAAAKEEATSPAAAKEEATSPAAAKEEATSPAAAGEKATSPVTAEEEATPIPTKRMQKDRHVEPKAITTESPRTTPVEAATQPRMKPVPQYKAGLMSGLLGKESPTESGEVDEEPLIDEERTHGIEAFYNKKSQGGGGGTSPNSSKHSDSKYKPYFIPLLILIIILALIIIFLLICIILMMKLEDREDYRSEPSSRGSEKKPLLSKSEDTTDTKTKTPKKSSPSKRKQPAPAPPPQEPPQEQPPPEPRGDGESANFAPIIISGKPHKEKGGSSEGGAGSADKAGGRGAGGPGAGGSGAGGDQRGAGESGRPQISTGEKPSAAQQAPPPVQEKGSSKERENMPKVSTEHMF